jgi:colanic acid biosynthesis glycosyl transferase WcaI
MVMASRRRWFRSKNPARTHPERPPSWDGATASRIAVDLCQEIPPAPPRLGGRSSPVRLVGKRILFINQYYWPDHASTAQHLADLAESLAERGYECHVLCSQSRYKPGEPRPPAYEIHEGVRIHRVPATSLGRRGTWARMTDYLSFYAGAIFKAMTLPRFDAAVTLTTPPIIGLVGTLLKWLRGTRHVYWSMDLHPDASLALGRMSSTRLFPRFMYWLSSFVYRQADKVVVLGPYMADRIALKQVANERVVTIPVWSRREEIYPIPRPANPIRRSLGLQDAFVAMYSGNLGLAHSSDEFLAAARRLRDREDIVFLFVGGGPRIHEVELARDREGLTNVRLLDYFPRDQLHASLSLADVHLISMRPEMTGVVVPGKLYGVMAASRPAIFVGPEHCETADTIRHAGCGFTITPGDADALVSALTLLAGDSSLGRRMGERGRSAFLTTHERKLCCNQWYELMSELVARPSTTAQGLSTRQRGPRSALEASAAH